MKDERMKKVPSKPRRDAQEAELAVLEKLHDDQIDTGKIPEQRDWTGARRGLFFRPIKKQLTLRLDVDLIDWFKARAPNGEGYQTDINSALRAYVEAHERTRDPPP